MKALVLVALASSTTYAADTCGVLDTACHVAAYVTSSGLPALKPAPAHRFIVRVWTSPALTGTDRVTEIIQDDNGGGYFVVGKGQDGKKWSITGMMTVPEPAVKQPVAAIEAFMKDPQAAYGCAGTKDEAGYTIEVATRDGYRAASICDAKANKDVKLIVDYMRAADKASGL